MRKVDPYTEADPAAVLATLLAMFGSAVGRGPHFLAGDAEHHTNLFVCIVGDTGEGRKGTSAEAPRRLLVEADETWRARIAPGGLVSGEGVIHHVRDPRTIRRQPKKGEPPGADGFVEDLVDPGVEDKRLFVVESEFASVLAAVGRKDSTLSATLRNLWDRGDAATLAKNAPERVTGALVSLVTHITPVELRARLDSTEIANGFANRIIFVASRRSKLRPRGGSVPLELIAQLVPDLRTALRRAQMIGNAEMTDPAWDLWDEHYEKLTTRPPGLFGAVTGRAAPVVRRIALVYMLLDESDQVDVPHLEAALELWRYGEESVRWVFGDRLGERLADKILGLFCEADGEGMTRNELREALGHGVSATKIEDALRLLKGAGVARMIKQETGGRPTERWFAQGVDDSEDR